MSDSMKYSGLVKKSIDIPPYSVATIEYNETLPNYYRVQNRGTNRIFCGTSHIPTANRYDFAVGGEKVKLYGEPFNKNNLYIFNPSGVTVGVTVTSFAAPFDPTTIALSDLEIDLSASTVETSTVITGFNSALPNGNNNIGKVTVANPLSLSNLETALSKLVSSEDLNGCTNLFHIWEAVRNLVIYNQQYAYLKSGTATADGVTFNSYSKDYQINEIAFLSNDGESELTLTLIDPDYGDQSIVIKAGEVLNHIKTRIGAVKLSGNDVPYRLAYEEVKW